MRRKGEQGGLTVQAIAGTHVVLLGLDLAAEVRAGCLGFAVQRQDHTEDERFWLKGTKTFEATDPGIGPGGQVSTREHPIQSFQWADYSAKPDHDYTYKVVALYGTPERLEEGMAVSVRIATESEHGQRHTVYFNRGAVASQEYARRFENRAPSQLAPQQRQAAYRWLSRGLLESLVAFAERAQGPAYGLYGAVYEFQWSPALNAIRAAADRGADVRVVYDAIPGATGPAIKNEVAILAAGLADHCSPRTVGKIMHNKFFVLTENGIPIAVWTGSTNLTENGLFGHSNCAHVVEDTGIAAAYLAYWEQLRSNPSAAAERAWMGAHNPAPPDPWDAETTAIFSPRSGLRQLTWYAEVAASAQQALFMTFAFGMHASFREVYERNDGVLRFALMEKEGNGAGLAQGKVDVDRLRRLPNIVVAVGNTIQMNSFDRWLKERAKLTTHANVRWIHTKYMLVDPLGPHPVVITGSANFSAPSTNANNENMLVIRDNSRVADIYLGEFMRLYSHYAFREAVARAQSQGTAEAWRPNYLIPDDSWQRGYFWARQQRSLRRRYFAGTWDQGTESRFGDL